MKIRNGFVSNSSSCAFIITNLSKNRLSVIDFVKENPELVKEFCAQYDWYDFDQDGMIASAEQRLALNPDEYTFEPGERKELVFGDEQGDVIGHVFDYILRNGGRSDNWTWRFKEFLR